MQQNCLCLFYKHYLVYVSDRIFALARRYLDRNTKERFRKMARAGEFSDRHITEKGPKIPEFDDLAPKRIIFLHDTHSDQNVSEIVNEKIDELRNAAAETGEYIKIVNEHLDKQKTRIDDLKTMQKVFDSQIDFLTSKDHHEKKKAN
jgi:hypothetical protein